LFDGTSGNDWDEDRHQAAWTCKRCGARRRSDEMGDPRTIRDVGGILRQRLSATAANYVAVLLERAGVVQPSGGRPALVRLADRPWSRLRLS
jgi:hypothetical protein